MRNFISSCCLEKEIREILFLLEKNIDITNFKDNNRGIAIELAINSIVDLFNIYLYDKGKL